MITTKTYNELKRKIAQFDAWVDTQRNPRNGWASYRVEDIPKHLSKVSNDQRSFVEVYEFVHTPPEKYFIYVERNVVSPGEVDNRVRVTTWTGQTLGYGYLGRPYKCGNSRRYPIRFKGINGFRYAGTYYVSTGDYARVKKVKE
jgi:hypothetical protein